MTPLEGQLSTNENMLWNPVSAGLVSCRNLVDLEEAAVLPNPPGGLKQSIKSSDNKKLQKISDTTCIICKSNIQLDRNLRIASTKGNGKT